MLEIEIITMTLNSEEIHTVGSIVPDENRDRKFFIPIAIARENELQKPSNKKLKDIADVLKIKHGITVEFLLHDSQSADVESGLRATLLHNFGDFVRNVFLTVNFQGESIVWIDRKKTIDIESEEAVAAKARFFLKDVGIINFAIYGLAGQNLPGVLVLLRLVRKNAPVNLNNLEKLLQAEGYVVPSVDWLRRKLDGLRKAGRVIRTTHGDFVLSLEALRDLGTAKNRASSDIVRALAIARKVK